MASQQGQTDNKDKNKTPDKSSEMTGGSTSEECRCKEMSKKTFPELLKSMLRDFAFWKKRPTKI